MLNEVQLDQPLAGRVEGSTARAEGGLANPLIFTIAARIGQAQEIPMDGLAGSEIGSPAQEGEGIAVGLFLVWPELVSAEAAVGADLKFKAGLPSARHYRGIMIPWKHPWR
jgi:hypothetical protein